MIVYVTIREHRFQLYSVVGKMVHFLELYRGVVFPVEHKAIIQTTLAQFTEILRHEV